MRAFNALIRRELWEHPALYMGPLIVAGLTVLSSLIAFARGLGTGARLETFLGALQIGGPEWREAGLSVLLASPITFLLAVVSFIALFYFLDCLYAERKERSILFFKSLPVTDLQTVLSKLASGTLVLSAITLGTFVATQIVVLIVGTVYVLIGSGELSLLWNLPAMLTSWILALYSLLALQIWSVPIIGFLMLVSAWAKRAVFLWAGAPFLLIGVEFLFTGQSLLARLIYPRLTGFWAAAYRIDPSAIRGGSDAAQQAIEQLGPLDQFDLLRLIDPAGFLADASVWIGLVVGAAFIAGAIVLRRYRDDS